MKNEFGELTGETFVAKGFTLHGVQIFGSREHDRRGAGKEDRRAGIAGTERAFLLPFGDVGAEKAEGGVHHQAMEGRLRAEQFEDLKDEAVEEAGVVAGLGSAEAVFGKQIHGHAQKLAAAVPGKNAFGWLAQVSTYYKA